MANTIQAMRNVYDVMKASKDNGTPLTDAFIQTLLEKTVNDSELIKNYKRFESGYAAEDLFMQIYSMLPWVKRITPLGQEQFPERSKEDLQVTDYEVIYEVGDATHTNTVLIEAKLVDGEKQTHELKKYQYEVLKKYADEKGMDVLFALFWRKAGLWTVVPIEAYDEKSSAYKISRSKAYTNDVSAIFGDYSYVFRKAFYRKSLFSEDETIKSKYLHNHIEYGKTLYESLSMDGVNYEDLCLLEPPVLDCAFYLKKKYVTMANDKTELIEEIDRLPYSYRLSQLILKYLLKIYCYESSDMYCRNNEVVKNTFAIVDTVRRKCGGEKFYLMPEKNSTSNKLIYSQFGSVCWIMDAFNTERNDESVILVSHDNLGEGDGT